MTQAAKDAAKFLKSTLRLPSTTFPARPPPADLAKYLPRCTDDLYAWQRRERPTAQKFILHDGPPYANGDLHVGHALNKIVKDIISRSQLAQGKRIEYIPGWDCHGLPIELKALEHQGWKRGQGVDAVSIRKVARDFAQKAVEKQMSGFKSWAVMGDWDNHYETMNKDFELRQLAVFQAMAEHGLIYRKHKPVYWSPSSRTALAEAELEYSEDHISTAALVKFPLRNFGSNETPTYAVIWTTTPWTLPANQAIAISSDLQYSCVHSPKHGNLIIARSRLPYMEDVLKEELKMVEDRVEIDQLLSNTYDGFRQFGPQALDRPIIHADFVSAESGTGLVHCAPGHGMEDYLALQPLIETGRVAVRAPVDDSGQFDASASLDNPELLNGQNIFKEGNETVLRLLEEADMLLHQHQYKHKYPIDWRTKEPVIIRATAQWFADISSIKKDTMKAIEKVTFLPDSGQSRLRSFVENRSEWCISRQRAWGVPIPAIYHRETEECVLSPGSVSHIIKTIQDRGIDAWWADRDDDPAWIVDGLTPTDYRRGTDTMDVWFDSGTSWTLMQMDQNAQEGPLADVYLEGTDQHRGWFQSSLLTNVAYQKSTNENHTPHAPFRTLITHGFTLDGQGKKMSKSLGNVVAPDQIIAGLEPVTKVQQSKPSKKPRVMHSLGPDALRLWAASSDWTKDVVISETVVKTVHTALDKYRVTTKLLLGLLQDFNPENMIPYQQLDKLDQIALLQLSKVVSTVKKAYSDYEFHKAVTSINRWVVVDLSGFYFEAMKDIIYCDSPSSSRRLSAQTTLYHIFLQFQNMLGAITPLLVEESVEHSTAAHKTVSEHPLRRIWEPIPQQWQNTDIEELIPMITAINSAVKAAQEKARSEKLMGQSLACDVSIVVRNGTLISSIPIDTWKELLVVSQVEVAETDDYDATATRVLESQSTPNSASWVRSHDILRDDGSRIGVVIVKSPQQDKCDRCWRFLVQDQSDIPPRETAKTVETALCGRCRDAVEQFNESSS